MPKTQLKHNYNINTNNQNKQTLMYILPQAIFVLPRNVQTNNLNKHKTMIYRLIYTVPQALIFSPQDVQAKVKNMNISNEHLRKQKQMQIIFKSSPILCRRRCFTQKVFNKSWTIWKCLKNQDNYMWRRIYTLPQALVSLKNVQQIVKSMKMFKYLWTITLNKLIYILPQALLSPEDVQQTLKDMNICQKTWKTMKII